jgi:protein farnesyltransferase/geranylgeranyltransferase type-1 subunit alpha
MEDYMEDNFISFNKRGNLWADITPIDEFSNQVNILQVDYSDKLREINDYFRAILLKNEISLRAYELTKEVIEVNEYYYFKLFIS